MAESAATSFRKTLKETIEETGYNYTILHPDFNSVLSNGRIYSYWFKPGTIIASVEAEGEVIIFEIAGDLHADIFDPEGALVKTYEECITEVVPAEGLRLLSDRDINSLLGEGGMNGYKMELYEKTFVRAYLERYPDVHVTAKHPSVARAVVNKSLVKELVSRIPEAPAEEEVSSEDFFDIPEEDNTADEFFEEAQTEEPAMEISEAEEPSEKEEPEKPVKKQAARQAKKKEGSKKAADVPDPDEDAMGRYDLLPLDVIGIFIEEFDNIKVGGNYNFFASIEKFKESGEGLLDAAVLYAKSRFDDAVSAVMALAKYAEEDADKFGEDAWKMRGTRYFINSAVKEYLVSLKDKDVSDAEGHGLSVLWSLMCGAWVSAREK